MSELLLAKSADINASDGNGRPALHQVNARRYPTAAVLTAATQRAQKRTDNREYRCRVGNPVRRIEITVRRIGITVRRIEIAAYLSARQRGQAT